MNSQELRRDLGYWGAVAMVVGTVIGSGIFAVPKAMVLKFGPRAGGFAVWFFGGLQIAVTILKVALILAVVVIGMTAEVGTVSNYSTSIPAAGGWTGFFAAL